MNLSQPFLASGLAGQLLGILGLLLAQLDLQLLNGGLCIGQVLPCGGQVVLKVVVLCGEHLHLAVLVLKVEQRGEGQA